MSNEAVGAGSAVIDEQIDQDIKLLVFLDCLQRIDRPNAPFDRMLDRFRNNVEERRRQIERAERDKQRQLIREQRKQENRERRIKTGESVRKLLFVAALIGLLYVTYLTLRYTRYMQYRGNFGAWVENAGLKLAISLGAVGITFGINDEKGFGFFFPNGRWIAAYVVYALFYTIMWVRYTSDLGGILGMPVIFFSLFGIMLFSGWLFSKIFK